MKAFRKVVRSLLVAVSLYSALGAGCPFRQSDRDLEGAGWTQEVHLRVGESATVDEGRLIVSVPALEPGNRIANITIRLQSPGGESVEEAVEVVRNAPYSETVRLGAHTARVKGFPGVDSATLLVTRE